MEIISVVAEKQIKIYTVKGGWQLEDTIQSKVMAMVFAMASKIERDLISKRTREALQAKKASVIKLGLPLVSCKSKLVKLKLKIKAFLNNGSKTKLLGQTILSNPNHFFKLGKKE